MNDKENDKKKREEDLPEKGLEKGYANRHAEITEPGQVKRQEIPPEIEGDAEEVHKEADRRRNEGVERGFANRHAEVAGGATGPLPPRAPFTSPRTVAEPEGGWEAGFPKVYFSVYDRVPPIVVKDPNEEGAIDKANYMQIPPATDAPEPVDKRLTDAKMLAESERVGNRSAVYPPKDDCPKHEETGPIVDTKAPINRPGQQSAPKPVGSR
jgi:hypothetical protein